MRVALGTRIRWSALRWFAALCLSAVPGLCLAAAAPPGPPPLRDYVIDAWTTRNGLPHNSLRDIAQTPEGYLWFATWEGAVRYNGIEFTVIDRGTRPGLLDNGVGALYVDPHGRLWLSDSRGNLGLQLPDRQWKFWPRTQDWPQALIHDMAMDSHDRLWLLFEGHGLGCVHPDGRFEYFAPPPGLPLPASFPRMAIDAKDRIWAGTLDGLVIREPDGRWRRPALPALSQGLVWPYLAPDGTFWIASDERIYRVRDGEPVPVYDIPGLGHFTAMLQDRNGDLWLGTENDGIVRAGSHGIERMPPGQALPNGRIASLLEDAEGSIWAGANGGLFRLREAFFSSYTHRDGLSGDYVRAVLEDRDGALWIGGGGGLDRMERDGRIHSISLRGGNGKALSVLSLAQDPQGDLWVGSYADGVFRLRDGRLLQRYGTDEGLASGHVRALVADGHGVVWAGTQRGLARLEAGRALLPADLPGLPQGLITALASIDGALWIGSVEGASVLRGDRVEHLDLASLGGARSVFGFQKLGGDVWISTDRGLYRYRGGALARVGLEQGMPVDAVFQIVGDRAGNAWISSNRGVLRARIDALQAAAGGRGLPLQVERYTEADGLASSQANGSSAPSAILRRDGTLWVATAAGLVTADPARIRRYLARRPPPVVIEGVQLDGRDVSLGDFPVRSASGRASLPGGARINVSFAGLSYVLPERIRYRTRLLGLDDNWIDRGAQHNVEFNSLLPGDYTLQIAASSPGGAWGKKAAAWKFSVRPLWWQRRDTQAALALAVLLGLFALYRYRIQRYRMRNLQLARLVEERTRDLREQAERLLAVDRERTQLLERVREQAEGFSRQAREDPLTGLPNRRHFDEALARQFALAARGGQSFSLALLDLDHFKRINDTHSHGVGDTVLKETAQMLAVDCRAMDLLARLGGEEFALLLADTHLEQARAICERLQESFRARRQWAGVTGLQVTFSAGVAEFRPGDTPDRLAERADAALYRAKREGRDLIREG